MATFEWLPTECADERYPMQLISGQLDCGDDIISVPAGKIVTNGWGEIGSRRLIGDPLKPVPERLSAAWFSYTEDQMFAGEVDLPKPELTALFQAGFREPLTRKTVTWVKIIVGMGLGGWTSVWLAGSGLVREVARAQLAPAELDWSLVLDNPEIERADFVRSKLRSRLTIAQTKLLEKHGPPASIWPRYSQTYRWRIQVEGLQVPLYMFLRSFNGDRSFFDFARRPPPELLELVPKQLQITWLNRSRRKLLTDIRLDEAEVYAAFDELCTAPDGPPAVLRIEYGTRSQLSITLERGDDRIPLTRANAEIASLAS